MKNSLKLFLIPALVLTAAASAILSFNAMHTVANESKPAQTKSFRYVSNEAFGYGEKLEYKVGYKFITAGTGYFYILPKPTQRNGRDCYDVRFQVRSLSSLEWLYKVQDEYSTVLDIGGIFPWEFNQKVREGNYKRDFKAVFDQANNKAYARNKVYNIPEYVHDIVSALFYVRTQNIGAMKPGTVIYLKNFFDDTTHSLGVKIRNREVVEVEAGKFKCICIEPMVVQGGLFKNEGKILVWVTDDERKIPVKVATKILIGYVSADLIKYSGLRGPLTSKIQ